MLLLVLVIHGLHFSLIVRFWLTWRNPGWGVPPVELSNSRGQDPSHPWTNKQQEAAQKGQVSNVFWGYSVASEPIFCL